MPEFDSLEASFSRLEHDGLRFITFNSPALGGSRGDVAVFVPPTDLQSRNLPLVVLLHGVYGSHWSWAFNGAAHLTALEMMRAGRIQPMVIAMPSDGLRGRGTGYLPLPSGDYERWIIDDVVGCVTQTVRCLGAESRLYLAGLSMGGYGAMRIGAKYAERVSGISSHSAPTRVDQMQVLADELSGVLAGVDPQELDVLYWMRRNRVILPPLRFDCGRDDQFIEANRRLHRDLEAAAIAHRYDEFEGGHSWAYWEEHLRDTLLFFDRVDATHRAV